MILRNTLLKIFIVQILKSTISKVCTFPMLIKHALTTDVPIIFALFKSCVRTILFFGGLMKFKTCGGVSSNLWLFSTYCTSIKKWQRQLQNSLIASLIVSVLMHFPLSFYAVSFVCWSTLVYKMNSTIPGFYCISHTGTYKLSAISTHKVTEK